MNSRKRRQGKTTVARRNRQHPNPRTLEEFHAMPETLQDGWLSMLSGVGHMRTNGLSAPEAAREVGMSAAKFRRLAAPALRKKSGKNVAKTHDPLLRPMLVLTNKGLREIGIRDSRTATMIGEHWNDAYRYLETGDKSVRRKYRGKSFTDASGKKVRLMTDLKALERQGHAGELTFESIYAK